MSASTAISIGNFDGVHAGHLALIGAARELVGREGRVRALVFDPHPLTVLRPAATPGRLSQMPQRERWLRAAGADDVIALPPTPQRLQQTPTEFVAWLTQQHAPTVVVEGPDFRFGRDRCGTVQTMAELGRQHGFDVHVIEPVQRVLADQSIVTVSSSMVRWLVHRGRVRDAATLLGRPFELECEVIRGHQRGRTLGMPTANLGWEPFMLPADGVYAGRALGPDETWYPAAISVGTNATFGEQPRSCEAHLIGFSGHAEAYGWTIRLQFTDWIRDQVAFEGVEALVRQMHRDLALVVETCAGGTSRS
ncbi:MAG: bifunctional riboflavin kinase/FMN adenylyltransferase, partial [Planctomycetota bacterium]